MTHTANDELVLLTSYFNLAGGRRQDEADTFRVESSVPSATSPDGVAALYVVTESSAGGNMGPRARRLVADSIAWEYQQHGEVPPAQRLRAAMRTAHSQIAEEFDGHVSVGASAIAVEAGTVYLAQAAPSQVYVVHDGRLDPIGTGAEGSPPFAQALGSSHGPQIKLFRDEVTEGDVLVLCSSWFGRGPEPAEVERCFESGTAEETAEALLDLAKERGGRDVAAIAIEVANAADLILEEDDAEAYPGFIEQVDQAVQALAGAGRLLLAELRPPGQSSDTPAGTHEREGTAEADDHVDDFEDAGLEPATTRREPASRFGGLFSGARALRRPRVDRRGEPTHETLLNGEEEDDYRDLYERASGRQEERERPYREQPTEELHATEAIVAPDPTSEEPADAAPDRSFDTAFARQETTELELPTQDTAEIPAIGESFGQDSRAADEVPERTARPVLRDETDHEHDVSTYAPPPPSTRRGAPVRRSPIRESRSASSHEPEPEPPLDPEIDEINARLDSGPDMGEVVPPVQTFPDTSTEPSRIYATSRDAQAANRRPRRFGGIARPVGKDPLQGPPVIRPGTGDIDLRRPAGRPAPPAAIWGVGVLFLALIVVAAYIWFQNRNQAAAVNPYPALVRKDLRKATAAKQTATQDRWLARARANLTLARTNGATPAQLKLLGATLATTSDRLHRITRVASLTTLADFSKFPSARPTEIAVSPGLVFVLDAGRKSVFSLVANAPSTPTEIVTSGESDSGYSIATPVQIATDGATALVLDSGNVLVRDLGGAKSATALTPGVQTPHYVGMSSSDPDVYLLDTASNQVWRFPYAVSGFNPPAATYFDTNQPDLSKAVSFVYDASDLYILLRNGTVLKFDNAANPVKFNPQTRTPLNGPRAIYTDQGLKDLWIADPANSRIVEIGKDGSYVRSYVSPSFRSVSSMAVGPAGNTAYALAGSKVVSFSLAP